MLQTTCVANGHVFFGDEAIHGVVKFLQLLDTPGDNTGQAGKVVKVNNTETGLIYGLVSWAEIQNIPTSFPPDSHTHAPADILPQGDGSGLNADTVDSKHASDFAPLTHSHEWSDVIKTGSSLEDIEDRNFLQLQDTPADYTGKA